MNKKFGCKGTDYLRVRTCLWDLFVAQRREKTASAQKEQKRLGFWEYVWGKIYFLFISTTTPITFLSLASA
jgi:hypothetical protein